MKQFKVLVVGDLIIDIYRIGDVLRCEQDSNVPIFHQKKYFYCLGGAGNVAANVAATKIQTYLCTIANYKYKNIINELILNSKIDDKYIKYHLDYSTSIKNRYYRKDSLAFRVDVEGNNLESKFDRIRNNIWSILKEEIHSFDCVIISDYGKGLLSESFLRNILDRSKELNIPTIVDPNVKSPRKYFGAYLIKLNKNELEAIIHRNLLSNEQIISSAKTLLSIMKCKIVIITCSNLGIFYVNSAGDSLFRRNPKEENAYVIGAGDTVAAYTAYGLLNKYNPENLLCLLSTVGNLAVKKMGTSHIKIEKVKRIMKGPNCEKKNT